MASSLASSTSPPSSSSTVDADVIGSLPLLKNRHIKFLNRLLLVLPEGMASMETSRMTIAYFSISGLDILGALDELGADRKAELIDWIYSLQVRIPFPDSQ